MKLDPLVDPQLFSSPTMRLIFVVLSQQLLNESPCNLVPLCRSSTRVTFGDLLNFDIVIIPINTCKLMMFPTTAVVLYV